MQGTPALTAPCPATTKSVVTGVAMVTQLSNGPWLSEWIKSYIWAPLLLFKARCRWGPPKLNDVTEEGWRDMQWLCGLKMCERRWQKSLQDRQETETLSWLQQKSPDWCHQCSICFCLLSTCKTKRGCKLKSIAWARCRVEQIQTLVLHNLRNIPGILYLSMMYDNVNLFRFFWAPNIKFVRDREKSVREHAKIYEFPNK